MAGDDYLWERAGEPDPEVERLERLLGGFASDGGDAAAPDAPGPRRRWRLAAAAGVAAAALVAVGWALRGDGRSPSGDSGPSFAYEAEGTTGPTSGRLAVGGALETRDGERVRLTVADIGTVTVGERSRLALVATGPDQHRMRLERGAIHAVVHAPPRLFIVETPSVEAVDLGCEYTLEVDDRGRGLLRVASGQVALERAGRAVTVPYDAVCPFDEARGAGTPRFEDAPEALVRALGLLDGGGKGDLTRPLRTVLEQARKRDTLTLFHLLPRFEGRSRERIYDRMAALVAPPRDVTREGTLALDQDMLTLWFDELRWEAFDP